jgi:hypothetical protein
MYRTEREIFNMPKKTDSSKPRLTLERTPDFVSRYANHVRFESTVFDLKVVFGQTDLSNPPHEVVFQHTAMTIPWADAKLILYYLTVQLIFQEADNGTVVVPPNQAPAPLPPLPPHLKNNEAAQRAHETAAKYRESFLAMMSKPIA